MAVAAAFSSSRTTKGLFLIFTLLSLLCFTNSLMDKNQLEKLKENYEEMRTKVDKLKADHVAGMAKAAELGRDLDQKMALSQEEMKKRFPDFPALDTYFENNKRYLEQYNDYVNKKYEDFGEKIENQEKNVRTLKKLIEFLEENQAEL